MKGRPSEAFLVPTVIQSPSLPMTKPRILKNVVVLSSGALLLFTAYEGLSMLQSTVNSDQGIGVMSQAVLYICFCASALVFPKYVIKKLGSKLTLVLSMLSYIPYVASNVYPHWSVMIPTSILIGLGAALLWGSQANYLNDVSVLYAELLLDSEGVSREIGKEELCSINKQSMSGSVYGSLDRPLERQVSFLTSPQESGPSNFDGTSVGLPTELNQQYANSEQINENKRNCLNEEGSISKVETEGEEHSSISIIDAKYCVLNQKYSLPISNDSITSDQSDIATDGSDIKTNQKNPVSIKNDTTRNLQSNIVKDIKLNSTSASRCLESSDKDTNRKSIIESANIRRKKLIESSTARFFGFHGMVYLSSFIWSNLLSYFLMQGDFHVGRSTCACGANFCDADACHRQQEKQVMSDSTRYVLTGVCVGLGLAAVLLIWLLLDQLNDKSEGEGFETGLLMATVRLARRTELLLLMPMSLYLGMAQAFFAGDITKAFIGCVLGPSSVGLVAAAYGAASALSALLSGWTGRWTGRPALFTFHALLNATSCVLLLMWKPDPERPVVIFVMAAMWGLYVGTSFSQIRAFYGVLFKADEEAAFATFHTWYSLGFFISFVYSNYICTYVKIYVLLAVSTTGFAGYLAVEWRHYMGIIQK